MITDSDGRKAVSAILFLHKHTDNAASFCNRNNVTIVEFLICSILSETHHHQVYPALG